MTESHWRRAKPPNYKVNTDLKYPYSDFPFVTEYALVKIPPAGQLIDHVDYWGEGRIVSPGGISGFPNCYNVNRQFQCVSNGPDTGKKIPNRIPVVDENHCDSSKYIEDNSVKVVTLMGAPITKCAQDIARMVNSAVGMVVVYGFNDNAADIKLLQNELKTKSIFYSFAYTLPDSLKGLTLFNNHLAFLNATEITEELYNNITGGDYVKAVEIFKTLDKYGGGDIATEVVKKILDQGIINTTNLVYHLWHKGRRDIVIRYFPKAYELIFDDHVVQITSKHFGLALKLDATSEENDRFAWGDASDKSLHRLRWRIIPEFLDNTCVFKILNMQYDLYLMMDATPDPDYGDRKVWGAALTGEERFRWNLDPKMVDGQLVFLVVNRVYKQGWKLDSHTDSYGDRGLWGHNGLVAGDPNYFGFYIQPLD